MWKYGTRTLVEGESWVNDSGIRHPPNWQIWSAAEKASAGLTEVTLETPPDDRFYRWTRNGDGTISSTARSINDIKATLIVEVKQQQDSILAQTDWAVVRKADVGTAIPANIATWRAAIRTKATEMETAIDNVADIAAIVALFVTGVLYDWPNLDGL